MISSITKNKNGDTPLPFLIESHCKEGEPWLSLTGILCRFFQCKLHPHAAHSSAYHSLMLSPPINGGKPLLPNIVAHHILKSRVTNLKYSFGDSHIQGQHISKHPTNSEWIMMLLCIKTNLQKYELISNIFWFQTVGAWPKMEHLGIVMDEHLKNSSV